MIVDLLREQGFTATQSSVSRDLKQLGVTKFGAYYEVPEIGRNDGEDNEPDQAMFTEFVRDIKTAGTNITVIRTAIGAAQRVAVYLDRTGWPEIIGTVSGDDTIFIATAGAVEQKRLVAKLRERTHH